MLRKGNPGICYVHKKKSWKSAWMILYFAFQKWLHVLCLSVRTGTFEVNNSFENWIIDCRN